MELASAQNLSGLENCGEIEKSATERDFPATNRIVHLEGKQKTPAPDSARAFYNARRSQVNEGSLTRNEI
jgi:hypothetical protein